MCTRVLYGEILAEDSLLLGRRGCAVEELFFSQNEQTAEGGLNAAPILSPPPPRYPIVVLCFEEGRGGGGNGVG